MKMTEEQRTLADAALANKINLIHHAYVDIAGDLIAGALLGQVLYWFGTGKDGKRRARIKKDGYTWIAKTRTDWHDEIRISPKQYDRAAKILKDRGFIEIKTFKFAGNPTTHIRIVPEAINAAIDKWKFDQVKTLLTDWEKPTAAGFLPMGNNEIPETSNPLLTKGEQRALPFGNNDIDQRGNSYTETTAENKTEITKDKTHTPTAEPSESAPASLLDHRNLLDQIDNDFEKVWREYPKKEGKAKARQAFARSIRGMGQRKADGEPYTADEILAEVVLYRQHVERLQADGELTYRFVPTGGKWFEQEGWTNSYPSISSSFDSFSDGVDHNRAVQELRRCAAMIGKAADQDEMKALRGKMAQLIAAMPY